MNSLEIATLLTRVISLVNSSMYLVENSQKYRELVAQAISEGRDLTSDELEALRDDAQTAVDKL